MNYKGYKDLECYKEARKLRMYISDLVKSFPKDEKYISEDDLKRGEKKCELVFKLTNGYIGYLDKSKAVTKPNSKLQNPNSSITK